METPESPPVEAQPKLLADLARHFFEAGRLVRRDAAAHVVDREFRDAWAEWHQ